MRVQEYLPVVHRLRLWRRLRSRLTQGGRTFPWKPWAIGVQDSTLHSLLTPAFSLPCSHRSLRYGFSVHADASLPLALQCESAALAACLAPVHFRRRATRLVSCYALFKGWSSLSQPPSCLRISTSFSTQHAFWGLAGDPRAVSL